MARVAILEGEGTTFEGIPTPEDVADQWEELNRVGPAAAEFTQGVGEQTAKIVRALGLTFD
jgi:hypothetical protein